MKNFYYVGFAIFGAYYIYLVFTNPGEFMSRVGILAGALAFLALGEIEEIKEKNR